MTRVLNIFIPLKFLVWLCLANATLVCNTANAVQLKDLYTFETIVHDNSHATRLDLLPTAFDQVLLKVVGKRDVLSEAAVFEAKAQIDKYVRDFSYREGADFYKLIINFDEGMINKLLSNIGHVHLSKNRPLVITWLVVQDENLVEFISNSDYSAVAEYIDQSAQKHGIPVVLPLLDLTERLFVKPQDVVIFNEIPLQQAAGRYNADLVLAGTMTKVAAGWQFAWRLYAGGQTLAWTSTGADLDIEIDNMLEALSENLSAHYSKHYPQAVNKKEVLLKIQGVKNVDDYAKIVKYLLSLSPIKKVDLCSLDANQSVFAVNADGGLSAIRAAVALDRVLIEDTIDVNVEYLNYKVN